MRWRDANSSEAPENRPDEIRQAYKKFLEVREYTEHQAIYCHLFKRAMRDGKIEHDERLNFPSSYLTKSDYEYWCKADYWTDYEFIGLLTERQPKRIATVLDYNETVLSDVGKQAERLHLLLRRARDTRHIEAYARPHDLLVWAKKKRLSCQRCWRQLPKIMDFTTRRRVRRMNRPLRYSRLNLTTSSA